jgi:hypothetical protein
MPDKVIVRFKRPSGSRIQEPSEAMADALRRLGESEEMQPLLTQATKSGKTVSIEVFQSRDGQPILIHIAKESA